MKTISEMEPKETRKQGHYWVKPFNQNWGVYEFAKSWGIFGWWGIAEECAIYDEDIELVGDFLEPPQSNAGQEAPSALPVAPAPSLA